MPSVPAILQMRHKRSHREQRNPLPRFGLVTVISISLLLVSISMAISIGLANIVKDLPSLETLPILLDQPDGLLLQPTRIYDRTGEHLLATLEYPGTTRYFFTATESSQLKKLPIVTATLAAYDRFFWEHPGVMVNGLFSSWKPIIQADGNSNQPITIAQRLVRDVLLWNETPGTIRNIREIILALQITARYGREQILQWYFNSAEYGPQLYGIETAAQAYFHKRAVDLNFAEAAVLVSTNSAPGINPFSLPDLTRQNGADFLLEMYKAGWITVNQIETIDLAGLQFAAPPAKAELIAQEFTRMVVAQLQTKINRSRLERGGIRVITTLDYDLQQNTLCVARIQLGKLRPSTENNNLQNDTCPAARLLPTLTTPIEIFPKSPQTNILILDPRSGQILSLVAIGMVNDSSKNIYSIPFDKHPTGTLLSPFVYLAGYTRGHSPASLVWDIQIKDQNSIANLDNQYHGPMRSRQALANDSIPPIEQVFTMAGGESVYHISRQLGLSTGLTPEVFGESPGSQMDAYLNQTQVNALEIGQAYAILANKGYLEGWRVEEQDEATDRLVSNTVLRVEDSSGSSLTLWNGEKLFGRSETRSVISEQLAYLVTNVLTDEIARRPSLGHPNPFEIGRPLAAKIGRTAAGMDSWAVGYTPQREVVIWMGTGIKEENTLISIAAVTGLWHGLMQYALIDQPVLEWEIPPGIQVMDVCDPSGLLPDEDCQSIVTEFFLDGNQPTQTDTLYSKLLVNVETGRLATVFTPPQFVQEKVFLNIPSQAKEWAIGAGIPLAPDTYDVIQSTYNPSETVRIDSPGMFAFISGEVTITGTAKGSDFNFYQVRAGKGLFPDKWIQLSEEQTRPVENGTLATWDTTDLDGLYTIQLLVVGKDQLVKTGLVQVTVDNIPPTAEIKNPIDEGKISLKIQDLITIQVMAEDNLGIGKVDIYLDGKLIASKTQSPYVHPWVPQLGEYNLKVVVADLTGNTIETQVSFSVIP